MRSLGSVLLPLISHMVNASRSGRLTSSPTELVRPVSNSCLCLNKATRVYHTRKPRIYQLLPSYLSFPQRGPDPTPETEPKLTFPLPSSKPPLVNTPVKVLFPESTFPTTAHLTSMISSALEGLILIIHDP